MKTKPSKQTVLWAGLLLCCPVAVWAVPVTFQVDMEYQLNQGTFTPQGAPPDTVEVRGSWNGFGGGLALNNVPGTTQYTNTMDVAGMAGNTITYKFHTYGTHDTWENFIGGCYDPTGGNRNFILGSSAQTLPVDFFNDNWDQGSVALTVSVDMSAAIQAGTFNPATDFVELKGAFNNWGGGYLLTNDPTGASGSVNVYSQTYNMTFPAPNGQAAYKFHTYGVHDVWESDPNRISVMTNPVTVLPVACFNRSCAAPVPVALYMQVDMNSQIVAGNFDPAGFYQLWADGDNLGGWGDPPNGMQMFEDTSRPGIFTNYWSGLMSPGATFPFKFKIWNTTANATTWENLPGNTNRSVVWQGTEPLDANGNHLLTLGPVLFSNFKANPNDYLPNDVWVTFTVDMSSAYGVTNNNADGGINWNDGGLHSVYLNGGFVNNGGVRNTWWPFSKTVVDSPPTAWQMTNNPVGSQLYSLQVLLPKGHPVRVDYKYSIDGFDNEAAAFQDHFRAVRSLGFANYAFPQDTFGTNYSEPTFGNLSIGAPVRGTVPLSWLGLPGVHLQSTASLGTGTWTDLYQTDGTNWTAGTWSKDGLVSLTNYPVGASATFFRLLKPGPSGQ